MQIIKHRINTVQELLNTQIDYGVEVDIRSSGRELTVHHDAFSFGITFDEWLEYYRHGKMIVNCKEEGIEAQIVAKLLEKSITDYIFLDCSSATINRYKSNDEFPFFGRVSYFECLDNILNNTNLFSGIWIDTFSGLPLNREEIKKLSEIELYTCLVSPELIPGRNDADVISLKQQMFDMCFEPNAVCTKNDTKWLKDDENECLC